MTDVESVPGLLAGGDIRIFDSRVLFVSPVSVVVCYVII